MGKAKEDGRRQGHKGPYVPAKITLGVGKASKIKKTRCFRMLPRPLLFAWLTMKSRLARKAKEIRSYGLLEPEE